MGSSKSSMGSSPNGENLKRVSLSNKTLKLEFKDTKEFGLFTEGKASDLLERYAKKRESQLPPHMLLQNISVDEHGDPQYRRNVGERIATLGSQDDIIVTEDVGIFAAIVTAYNYHWILRTCPEDWWFCVIKKVSQAIDNHSKEQTVRTFFVNHEGKKTITVNVPTLSIYGIDYEWFFDEISKQIDQSIKVPGYVKTMTADFSSTTAVHKIVSQVTVMSSVQEYFDFECMLCCGIPAIEMLGSKEDWENLLRKAKQLRNQLKPLRDVLHLEKWWETVENVFRKLLATFQNNPDKKWWSHILSWKVGFMSGEASGWEGWLVDFLDHPGSRKEDHALPGGLVTVPLIFSTPCGKKDTAALVAGMLGFTVHKIDHEERPSVQPFQGWSLLLEKRSPFRN
ncbi:uncharacterized protein LOC5515145 [Nematostella vectensis]|uniref:uncharacterized protein LOC5515145 n=1 Tax=Nematostella vectensis TaxID=45351 RepID=UPI002076F416|nr:uncharacterized protein LOC5515145 [Nematostella vectensis]